MTNKAVQRQCRNCGYIWTISKLEAKEKTGQRRKISEGSGRLGATYGRRGKRAKKALIYEAAVAKNQRVIVNATCANCGTYGNYGTPISSNGLPVAGWYKNPEDESQYRYWDGSNWTEHYAPIS